MGLAFWREGFGFGWREGKVKRDRKGWALLIAIANRQRPDVDHLTCDIGGCSRPFHPIQVKHSQYPAIRLAKWGLPLARHSNAMRLK